jgi:hypothetical protein
MGLSKDLPRQGTEFNRKGMENSTGMCFISWHALAIGILPGAGFWAGPVRYSCAKKKKRDGDDVGFDNFLVMIERARGKEAGASAQVSSQTGAWEQEKTGRILSKYRLSVNLNAFSRMEWDDNRSVRLHPIRVFALQGGSH